MIKLITALCMWSMTVAVYGKETISLVWGFNITSNQAATLRSMADVANDAQNKYLFVLESRPGAGGSIAANTVLLNPKNKIVGMSSSFFIRPAATLTGSHNLDRFRPLMVQASAAPLAVFSRRHKTLESLLQTANASIGISGVGTMSDILAHVLKSQYPTVNIVQFRGMVDALVATAGQHIDGAIGFISDAQSLLDAGTINLLGYTGSKNIHTHQDIRLISKGFPQARDIAANYALFVSVDMPETTYQELRTILLAAATNPKVLDGYARDLLSVETLDYQQTMLWYNQQRQYWRQQASQLPTVR